MFVVFVLLPLTIYLIFLCKSHFTIFLFLHKQQENQEYIDSILEDVRWIQSGTEPFENKPPLNENKPENNGPWFGPVYKTSDSFQIIYDAAVELIKSGDAYVDSLTAQEMREYRGSLTEPGKDSPFRSRRIEENLKLFEKVSFRRQNLHTYRTKFLR